MAKIKKVLFWIGVAVLWLAMLCFSIYLWIKFINLCV
jgi:hypothetical protein